MGMSIRHRRKRWAVDPVITHTRRLRKLSTPSNLHAVARLVLSLPQSILNGLTVASDFENRCQLIRRLRGQAGELSLEFGLFDLDRLSSGKNSGGVDLGLETANRYPIPWPEIHVHVERVPLAGKFGVFRVRHPA